MAQHYRALFISDVHLGTRSSQAGQLLDFLRQVSADTIYLVGDIVDFWRIRRGLVWSEAHSKVLAELVARAHQGVRIVYIPGNHDDDLRAYCGSRFGRIELAQQIVHETVSGRRYLVIHGDEFDQVVRNARWLALLGERSYAIALAANRPLNAVRRFLGLDYWSLSAYLKQRVKGAVSRTGNFEGLLADAARKNQAEGVICGHIHKASSHQIGGVHYVNTGDWVESCTAVIENEAGALEIVDWASLRAERERVLAKRAVLEAAA